MTLSIGYATADITPASPIPLSGFVARCEAPCQGVHDPLSVTALYLKSGASDFVLLVFDLLGLDTHATERIHTALDTAAQHLPGRGGRIFCCTHTHSAPAAFHLLGCGEPRDDYIEHVCKAAVCATHSASSNAVPARVASASVDLTGCNYNRRALLKDGRVVMALHPGGDEIERGPTWDMLHLLQFEDADGTPIVGLAHWAAHACTVCSQQVTADFPGTLRTKLAEKLGFPVVYLQGACGNLNPPFVEMTFTEMHRNVASICARVGPLTWRRDTCDPVAFKEHTVTVGYGESVNAETASASLASLDRVAATGARNEPVVPEIENILNIEPGQKAPVELLRHTAKTLTAWIRNVLPMYPQAKKVGKQLPLKVLSLGENVLVFVAAEVFAETAIALQARYPTKRVLLVSMGAPLIGYLPTDNALRQGGYEVEYAYRFYGEPAAYARGSEAAVLEAICQLV